LPASFGYLSSRDEPTLETIEPTVSTPEPTLFTFGGH